MKSHVTTLAVVLALAGCGAAYKPKPSAANRRLQYTNRVHMLQAHNGLKIVIVPEDSTNLVEVDVRFQTGAKDDPEGKAGLAHLVEHLMFQLTPSGPGSETVSAQLAAVALDINAYTNWDSTHYRTLALSRSLDDVLRIELSRLGSDCSQLTQEVLDREREVVRNEIRERGGGAAEAIAKMIHEIAYPVGHAYRRLLGGDDQQLAAITLGDVCEFMQSHYAPANAALIITGKTSLEEVKALANKYLGAVRARRAGNGKIARPIRMDGKTVRRSLDVEEATAYAIYALPPKFDLDDVAASVVVPLLTAKLALDAGEIDYITDTEVWQSGGALAPILVAAVSVRKPSQLPKAVKFIDRTVEELKVKVSGFGVDMIRELYRASLLRRVERITSRADMFGDYVQFEGSNSFVVGDLERLHNLSPAAVKRVASETLARRTLLLLKPNSEAEVVEKRAALTYKPKTHDESTRRGDVGAAAANHPLSLEGMKARPLPVKAFTLKSGMLVYLVSDSSMPIVDLRLVFGAGTTLDSIGKPGVAEMTAAVIEAPSATRRDHYAAHDFVRMGGMVNWWVNADSTTFRVTGLAMYFDVLLQGLARTTRYGVFDRLSLAKSKLRLAKLMTKPEVRQAKRLVAELLHGIYGDGHPYAHGGPTPMALIKIERSDLARFKSSYYVPRNAALIVAGKFDAALMERHIRYQFDDWKADTPGTQGVDAPTRRGAGAKYLAFETDDSSQVDILMAVPTGVGVDEHHAARLVLENMLGQRMGAVRNRLGSTYGVHASYTVRNGPGMMQVSGSIDMARAGETLRMIHDQIATLRSGDAQFDAQFVHARRQVAQTLLADLSDSTSTASELSFVAKHRLGARYFRTLVKQVANLRPNDVKALAVRELADDRQTWVCAGTKKAVAKAYADAGLPKPKFVR